MRTITAFFFKKENQGKSSFTILSDGELADVDEVWGSRFGEVSSFRMGQ
jgi:hypothetical protein